MVVYFNHRVDNQTQYILKSLLHSTFSFFKQTIWFVNSASFQSKVVQLKDTLQSSHLVALLRLEIKHCNFVFFVHFAYSNAKKTFLQTIQIWAKGFEIFEKYDTCLKIIEARGKAFE